RQRIERLREGSDRRGPGGFEGWEPVVILRAVGDVLTPALGIRTREHDDRGDSRELGRHLDRTPFRTYLVDDQPEVAQLLEQRHQPTADSTLPIGSTRIMCATSGIAARIGIPQTNHST